MRSPQRLLRARKRALESEDLSQLSRRKFHTSTLAAKRKLIVTVTLRKHDPSFCEPCEEMATTWAGAKHRWTHVPRDTQWVVAYLLGCLSTKSCVAGAAEEKGSDPLRRAFRSTLRRCPGLIRLRRTPPSERGSGLGTTPLTCRSPTIRSLEWIDDPTALKGFTNNVLVALEILRCELDRAA
jgi:hypothetical protein